MYKLVALTLIVIGITGVVVGLLPNPEPLGAPIPQTLRLKALPRDIVKSELNVDTVRYAYKTNALTTEANEIASARTPHSRLYSLGKTPEGEDKFEMKIYSGVEQFYKDTDGTWYQIEHATTTKDAYDQQVAFHQLSKKVIAFFIKTAHADDYFPDASAVDGSVSCEGACRNATWATVHDAATGDTVRTGTSDNQCVATGKEAGLFLIVRCFTLFNTGALPAGANISSATLTVTGTFVSNGDNDGNDYVVVVSATPASDTALVTADYDQLGTTALSDTIDYGSLNAAGTNTFTLNASGLAQITKAGISKFGLREGHDVLNDAYGGANNTYNQFNLRDSVTAGTGSDPTLSVTYTLGGAKINNTPLMVF